MARGRMISKSLSTSARYAGLITAAGKLGEFCQSIYPLLVAHSDDFGRLAGDPFTVKHAICPTSTRQLLDVIKALTALHNVGLVHWYEVDGRKCLQILDFDAHQVGLHKRTQSKYPDISGKFPEFPSEEKRTKEKRTEQKRIRDPSLRSDTRADHLDIDAMAGEWNGLTTAPIPRCRELSPARRKQITARLKERPMSSWREVFTRINDSPFCRGETERGHWKASFDWIIGNADNAIKVLEGKYDRQATPSQDAEVLRRFVARGENT